MIPKDIESGEQWQVRYDGLTGEVTMTGNKGQMVWLAKQRREFGAILERREIVVGAWQEVDIDNPDPEPAEEEQGNHPDYLPPDRPAEDYWPRS